MARLRPHTGCIDNYDRRITAGGDDNYGCDEVYKIEDLWKMNKVRLEDVSERGSSNLAQKDIEGLDGNYPKSRQKPGIWESALWIE